MGRRAAGIRAGDAALEGARDALGGCVLFLFFWFRWRARERPAELEEVREGEEAPPPPGPRTGGTSSPARSSAGSSPAAPRRITRTTTPRGRRRRPKGMGATRIPSRNPIRTINGVSRMVPGSKYRISWDLYCF